LKRHFLLVFLIPLFLPPAGNAWSAENQLRVEIFPKVIKQGEAYLVRAAGPPSVKSISGEFQGKKFFLASAAGSGRFDALIGVDLDSKPGKYDLKVEGTDGGGKVFSKSIPLKIEKNDFTVQKLTLPKSMVDLDPKTLERVNRESARVRKVFAGVREEKLWKGPFVRPLEGEVSGAFGVRRVINGQNKSPHSGIDLRAEAGTPVSACNDGIAALVDDLFFSGKTVVLDHGWGLYSMYFHLSEAGVSAGDKLRTGDTLGRVGSTGRSTGPHLHWGMILRGARVDPLSFLRLTQHLQE
jgi:murein DD-endopeptidase MepM/ murein hydrolase activator NlpD